MSAHSGDGVDEEPPPLQADDIFAVASLTKLVVAVGVLQLCEHGHLGLDEPVDRYLPEFAAPTVLLSYDVDSAAATARPARRPITVRDLLTHTAGLHHGFVSDDSVMGTLYARAGVVHDARQPLDEKVRRLGPLPLVHDPGAAWTYGLCSDVAARLVEVIAGESLERYLAREILEPLGMDTASYFVTWPWWRRRRSWLPPGWISRSRTRQANGTWTWCATRINKQASTRGSKPSSTRWTAR